MSPRPHSSLLGACLLALVGCGETLPPPPGRLAPPPLSADRVDPALRLRAPRRVPAALRGTHVAVGEADACVLGPTGEVQCFGRDGVLSPVVLPSAARAVELRMGRGHAVARTADGEVYTWGTASLVAPGDGTAHYHTRVAPTRAPVRARSIAASEGGTCVVLEEGATRCWGSWVPTEGSAPVVTLEPVAAPFAHEPVRFALRGSSGVALDGGGEVVVWGGEAPAPRRMPGLTGVEHVTAAAELSCGSSATAVLCWGPLAAAWAGEAWQRTEEPRVIAGAPGGSELATDGRILCGRQPGDMVWCLGDGSLLDEHDGAWDLTLAPRRIGALDGAIQLAAGPGLLCAAIRDGSVECLAIVPPAPPPPPS